MVSSATTTSSNVVTVSLSEAVTSNGGDLSANLADLEGLFTLKVGDTTLTGSDYTLSSANNQTLTFTIDAESNYIEKDEIVQVVYDANASTTTYNLKDGQNDFTADFTQLVTNSYVPSVVSSATTTSSNVVTVSLSEAVTSNGGDLSANLANLEGLFTLKVGDTTLTGSDYTLSSANNQTLTFTIDAESNYIEKDEIVQVVYDANASTTTHNLKDSQNDSLPTSRSWWIIVMCHRWCRARRPRARIMVTVSLRGRDQQWRRSECELGEPGGSVHLEGGRHDIDGIGLHAELGEQSNPDLHD